MDIKKDILWRVYLSFIFVVLVAAAIIGKGFYTTSAGQVVEKHEW